MKRTGLLFVFLTFLLNGIFAQPASDSLVKFSDIKFHSDFEKKAFCHFIADQSDTFNLFLAIDKAMSDKIAKEYQAMFNSSIDEINTKKFKSKDLTKRIDLAYNHLLYQYLRKYTNLAFFPSLFKNGNYNCVTSSILYVLAFKQLDIPYKIMLTSNHVYLVANPGDQSVVIETTRPPWWSDVFNARYKAQYVDNLISSGVINQTELEKKSIDELFEEKYGKVREADFNNLPGIQYYNLAIKKLEESSRKEAYGLLQKAYFFYPDPQVKTLLLLTLLLATDEMIKDKVVDIDYLAQLSRFDDIDSLSIPSLFKQIMLNNTQSGKKEPYCDSIFNRLIKQISNKKIKEEIAFIYYDQHCTTYRNSGILEFYAYQALKIKPDSRESLQNFQYAIQRKCEQIKDNQILLDTIRAIKQRYDLEAVKNIFTDYEMIALLGLAIDNYKNKKPDIGEAFIQKFEMLSSLPITHRELSNKIADAYRVKAEYYSGKNRAKEKEALEKGLKYAPNSTMLKAIKKSKGYL